MISIILSYQSESLLTIISDQEPFYHNIWSGTMFISLPANLVRTESSRGWENPQVLSCHLLWITLREERLVCLGANMHPIFSIKFAEIKWTDVSPQIQFLTMIACRPENLHWYAQSNDVRFEVRFFENTLLHVCSFNFLIIINIFNILLLDKLSNCDV